MGFPYYEGVDLNRDSFYSTYTLTIGFASAAGLFALRWLLLAISICLTKVIARWVPLTVLAGIFLIPILAASPLGPQAGAIVGMVILGLGLMGLGRAVIKAA